MNLDAVRPGKERGEEPDGAGTGDEQPFARRQGRGPDRPHRVPTRFDERTELVVHCLRQRVER